MSLHFDFAVAFDLRRDTPQQVIDTLKYMTRQTDYVFDSPPDHPFFHHFEDEWHNYLHYEDPTYFLVSRLLWRPVSTEEQGWVAWPSIFGLHFQLSAARPRR